MHELTIDRVGMEGHGVGTGADGTVFFVAGAVPGDRVRVLPEEGKKRYRNAELIELLEASADRVTPNCPQFQVCGGCDWLHWDYRKQLEAKTSMLRHCLERNNIPVGEWRAIVPAEQREGYRTRIQVRAEGGLIGFYKRRSHDIVDVGSCVVATAAVNSELRALRAEVGERLGRHKFEIIEGENGETQRFEDARHASGGFAQIHRGQNEKLKNLVRALVETCHSRKVLELFAGSGNFTFAYAELVDQVLAVDSDPAAIARAVLLKNTLELGGKAAFFALLADGTLWRKLPEDFKHSYDTLICDPPRSGLGEGVEKLIHASVKNLIYVSCSAVSFSKDCQWLLKHFSLKSIQPIDMFPHTRHIELVAHFSR